MPSLAPSGFGSVDCVPSRHGPTGGQHPWAGAAPAREARFEVSSWWCRASGRAPHGPASITFNAQMETRNDRTDPTRTATRCRRTFLERRPQGGCHGRRRSSRRPGVRRPMCGRCSGRHRNRAQIGRDRKVGRSQRCGARLVPARRPSVRPCRSRSRPAAVRRAARTGSASHGGAGLVENLEQGHQNSGSLAEAGHIGAVAPMRLRLSISLPVSKRRTISTLPMACCGFSDSPQKGRSGGMIERPPTGQKMEESQK